MKYYTRGETREDAAEIPGKPLDPEDAAEAAAEHLFYHRDGWEIPFGEWPITFTIVDDAGQEWTCEVSREDAPVFTSSEPKRKVVP